MSNSSRVWLITGCSSGFGRELVRAAVAAGDNVMATARHPEALASLARDGKDHVSTTAMDITNSASVEAAVAATTAAYGRIDVLVNNAGKALFGAVEEVSMEQLHDQLNTNFFGTVQVTKAVLPILREQGHGTIVQISSIGGQVTFPGFGAYHASKFALEGLSQTLANEMAPLGVRVMIVEPGAFRTNMNAASVIVEGLAPYRPTIGAFLMDVKGMQGAEPGDPAKAAQAIVTALASGEPPLRLALGNDAVDAIRHQLNGRLADLADWEHLSRPPTPKLKLALRRPTSRRPNDLAGRARDSDRRLTENVAVASRPPVIVPSCQLRGGIRRRFRGVVRRPPLAV